MHDSFNVCRLSKVIVRSIACCYEVSKFMTLVTYNLDHRTSRIIPCRSYNPTSEICPPHRLSDNAYMEGVQSMSMILLSICSICFVIFLFSVLSVVCYSRSPCQGFCRVTHALLRLSCILHNIYHDLFTIRNCSHS